MDINHLGIAAGAVVEHERRLAAARQARLVSDAERLAPRRPRRSLLWSLGRRSARPPKVAVPRAYPAPQLG